VAGIWLAIKKDLDLRDAKGWAEYGRPFLAFDGRNTLQDLYEEILDAAAYLKKLLIEQALRRKWQKRYKQSPKGQAVDKKYDATAKGKARRAKHTLTPKRQAAWSVYNRSPKGLARSKNYRDSPHGKLIWKIISQTPDRRLREKLQKQGNP
jgi:hypothetical protein